MLSKYKLCFLLALAQLVNVTPIIAQEIRLEYCLTNVVQHSDWLEFSGYIRNRTPHFLALTRTAVHLTSIRVSFQMCGQMTTNLTACKTRNVIARCLPPIYDLKDMPIMQPGSRCGFSSVVYSRFLFTENLPESLNYCVKWNVDALSYPLEGIDPFENLSVARRISCPILGEGQTQFCVMPNRFDPAYNEPEGFNGLTNDVSTLASPEALCPSSAFDFGERPTSATVTNAFPVVNAGDADLALGDARACCGATLSVPNPVVAPGATNLVVATLSLAGREPGRPVRKALYLATNDPARPWLRFEFTGSVSPAKEVEGR